MPLCVLSSAFTAHGWCVHALYNTAAKTFIAVIEHDGLPGGHGALGLPENQMHTAIINLFDLHFLILLPVPDLGSHCTTCRRGSARHPCQLTGLEPVAKHPGVLVALAGCLRGIQCGRSASAVGQATTSAVVTSIVCIVLATALITIVANILGI